MGHKNTGGGGEQNRSKISLVCLDNILPRSYQDLSRNLGVFPSDVNILHVQILNVEILRDASSSGSLGLKKKIAEGVVFSSSEFFRLMILLCLSQPNKTNDYQRNDTNKVMRRW